MVLLKHLLALVWTFTFYELFGVSHADGTCPKGHRVTRTGGCEECPVGYFYPSENKSQHCRPCTKCDIKSGSKVESKCQKTANAICRCRPGFVHRLAEHNLCKCDTGSGLKEKGDLQECHECEDGFFSETMNLSCKKWKECGNTGVKVNGTKKTDAICNRAPSTPPPTSNKSPSLTAHAASNTPKMTSTTPRPPLRNDASAIPALAVPTPDMRPFTLNIGMFLLLAFGIFGMLILMTLTCKLNIVHCIQSYKKPEVNAQDSLWGSPVEESGDSSPSSLDKLNPEP